MYQVENVIDREIKYVLGNKSKKNSSVHAIDQEKKVLRTYFISYLFSFIKSNHHWLGRSEVDDYYALNVNV